MTNDERTLFVVLLGLVFALVATGVIGCATEPVTDLARPRSVNPSAVPRSYEPSDEAVRLREADSILRMRCRAWAESGIRRPECRI